MISRAGVPVAKSVPFPAKAHRSGRGSLAGQLEVAIAAELRAAHDRLVAPQWSRIRAVLDADVMYRAKQLATGGAEKLFTDLHPDLHWSEGRLMLDRVHRRAEPNLNRGSGGLVLIPVVLGSPYVLIKLNTSTQTTLRYPARGVAALWTAGTQVLADSAVRPHRPVMTTALGESLSGRAQP